MPYISDAEPYLPMPFLSTASLPATIATPFAPTILGRGQSWLRIYGAFTLDAAGRAHAFDAI